MTGVKLRQGESIESAIRKLKKQVDRSGIIRKKKATRYHTKPSLAKKEKSKAASKRRK
ncbi:MAG: 30S ribosomal protein S21 [Chlamydiia bacterium]|nr:30S ribosomal protein S21 [Chlamydiia bacterium]